MCINVLSAQREPFCFHSPFVIQFRRCHYNVLEHKCCRAYLRQSRRPFSTLDSKARLCFHHHFVSPILFCGRCAVSLSFSFIRIAGGSAHSECTVAHSRAEQSSNRTKSDCYSAAPLSVCARPVRLWMNERFAIARFFPFRVPASAGIVHSDISRTHTRRRHSATDADPLERMIAQNVCASDPGEEEAAAAETVVFATAND